ncbi:MurR/RpiR family transcriptional regulator [Streptomyces rapamycinicus]|uniref:RpiR family transcriptional regulator n=2 Tax=Streptomyces rapamycinicus TaxID=1226757 RepID=A0A0A0N560_STRRN|nr:MurR/RpiR family transcriptional regulator [Streptomyces rapamycinicus]AGP51926.1 RpiR family transcriptional regulator [Streptomyces rapamycinicus NRRL 5491]MBB4779347.1 DNA-binding MurR/RpiR family transcriptional regulator [Streptomyces rapamycinicus]RLV75990.1 RpiR family transcriptional regulator [Streptomyces rapamycinicus NRRL 5491]UTP28131.1 MurR/RpiR family transcriptional regulator [Streptomyces rapamycinicus NRRL 5491]
MPTAQNNEILDHADAQWLGDALPRVRLSKAQSRVVDVIVRNPQLASYADLAEIAQRADVNSSTVVRAAQALGYRGWPDLQRELRARYLVLISTEDKLTQSGEHRSPLHDALTHDIDNLRQTLDNNTAAEAEAAIATLAAAKSILVVGAGSFAGPASVMAHLGSTMGYPISLENRGGVHLASAVNSLGPGDVLVVVNMWRSMKQIIVTAEAAREAGAAVVAITDMRRGRLATTVAEHLFIVPSEGISFFQSVTAATSVVYGLLAGMQAAQPERSRAAIRRTQQLWKDLDIYLE